MFQIFDSLETDPYCKKMHLAHKLENVACTLEGEETSACWRRGSPDLLLASPFYWQAQGTRKLLPDCDTCHAHIQLDESKTRKKDQLDEIVARRWKWKIVIIFVIIHMLICWTRGWQLPNLCVDALDSISWFVVVWFLAVCLGFFSQIRWPS